MKHKQNIKDDILYENNNKLDLKKNTSNKNTEDKNYKKIDNKVHKEVVYYIKNESIILEPTDSCWNPRPLDPGTASLSFVGGPSQGSQVQPSLFRSFRCWLKPRPTAI